MNFGVSAVDIASLVSLVWKVYNGWQRACGEYSDITTLLDTFLSSLERIEHEAKRPSSALVRSKKDRKELETILSGCGPTVRELNSILVRYKSLGRSRQRNWDRLRLGVKNLDEVRTKLTSHITAVSLYLNAAGISSFTRIERKLQDIPEQIQTSIDSLAEEIRAGRREGSILTSYGSDEKEVWKQLRRELIAEGMTSDFIHHYKPRIKIYLRDLAERGQLEERSLDQQSESADEDDQQSDEDDAEEAETVNSPAGGAIGDTPGAILHQAKETNAASMSTWSSVPDQQREPATLTAPASTINPPKYQAYVESDDEDGGPYETRSSDRVDTADEYRGRMDSHISSSPRESEVPLAPEIALSAEMAEKAVVNQEERSLTMSKDVEHSAPSFSAPVTQEEPTMMLEEAISVAEQAEQNREALTGQTEKLIFKDAVGRTFKFPFERCRTWQGMHSLIVDAFKHIEILGDQVKNGEYDLNESDGASILPSTWEHIVKPNKEISMHMWPFEDSKSKARDTALLDPFRFIPPPPPFPPDFGFGGIFPHLDQLLFPLPQEKRPTAKKPISNKSKSRKDGSSFIPWFASGSSGPSKNAKR